MKKLEYLVIIRPIIPNVKNINIYQIIYRTDEELMKYNKRLEGDVVFTMLCNNHPSVNMKIMDELNKYFIKRNEYGGWVYEGDHIKMSSILIDLLYPLHVK